MSDGYLTFITYTIKYPKISLKIPPILRFFSVTLIHSMVIVFLVILTLLAFAANSLFCRMALGAELIDPISFTTLRLVSGALILFIITSFNYYFKERVKIAGSWKSASALFIYAIAFSLAYLTLSTGTGALVLFGAVQLTMMIFAIKKGEKLSSVQWIGFIAAIAGLIYLVLPGVSAPHPLGVLLMAGSGIGWGIYSIRGKKVASPIQMTAGNFIRAAPMAIVLSLLTLSQVEAQLNGILLAVGSGAVTSGLGYVIWYKTLRHLTTSQASIIQLAVPVIAAFGGVIFLSEVLSGRLVISSLLVLGGVGLAVIKKNKI